MEAPVRHPRLPHVEAGVLLGFPCPSCHVFSEKYIAACGCYACATCHHHVPQALFGFASQPTAWLVNHPSPQ